MGREWNPRADGKWCEPWFLCRRCQDAPHWVRNLRMPDGTVQAVLGPKVEVR